MEVMEKMSMTTDAFIALSQQLSDRDVKYAKLEMMYEQERERRMQLESEVEAIRQEAEKWKAVAKQTGVADMTEVINKLLQKNVLLSLMQMQTFMENKVDDLQLAMLLRGFVLECVPEQLLGSMLGVINRVMTLPDKSEPPKIDNRTINLTGSDAIYNENPKV